MSDPSMALIIRNKSGIILQTNIKSLTSINSKGSFDILPNHSNFITLIEKNISYLTLDKNKGEYPLQEKGLLKAANNTIQIFLEMA